jgi:hypothetical protein
MNKAWIYYLVGIMAFGFAYEWLKSIMGQPVFFVGAIIYVLLLRLLAEKFGR